MTFQLGNNLPVSGKEAVLQVNASFFESVAAMAHTIDKVWSQDALLLNYPLDDREKMNSFFSKYEDFQDTKRRFGRMFESILDNIDKLAAVLSGEKYSKKPAVDEGMAGGK